MRPFKALERNVPGCGGRVPVHETLIGRVDRLGATGVRQLQDKLCALGARAT